MLPNAALFVFIVAIPFTLSKPIGANGEVTQAQKGMDWIGKERERRQADVPPLEDVDKCSDHGTGTEYEEPSSCPTGAHRLCASGSRKASFCFNSSVAVDGCVSCDTNTFTNSNNNCTVCKNCTPCGTGEEMDTPCSTFADNKCRPIPPPSDIKLPTSPVNFRTTTIPPKDDLSTTDMLSTLESSTKTFTERIATMASSITLNSTSPNALAILFGVLFFSLVLAVIVIGALLWKKSPQLCNNEQPAPGPDEFPMLAIRNNNNNEAEGEVEGKEEEQAQDDDNDDGASGGEEKEQDRDDDGDQCEREEEEKDQDDDDDEDEDAPQDKGSSSTSFGPETSMTPLIDPTSERDPNEIPMSDIRPIGNDDDNADAEDGPPEDGPPEDEGSSSSRTINAPPPPTPSTDMNDQSVASASGTSPQASDKSPHVPGQSCVMEYETETPPTSFGQDTSMTPLISPRSERGKSKSRCNPCTSIDDDSDGESSPLMTGLKADALKGPNEIPMSDIRPIGNDNADAEDGPPEDEGSLSSRTINVPPLSPPTPSTDMNDHSVPTPSSSSVPASASDYDEVEPDGGGFYYDVPVQEAWPNQEQLNFSTHYNLHSKIKGYAFVLNNSSFPNHRIVKSRQRRGSEVDFANMIYLFEQLGYVVVKEENLTGEEIQEAVKAFSKECHDNHCKSVIVTLMSHGRLNTISGTDLKPVSKRWVQQQFDGNHCKNLYGKPKIFFYQACREEDIPEKMSDLYGEYAGPKKEADIFIAHATAPGMSSLRTTVKGSWFVQAILEVFLARAHLDDLGDLMTKVNYLVCQREGKIGGDELITIQQVCDNNNRLRKKLFFLPKFPPDQMPGEASDNI